MFNVTLDFVTDKYSWSEAFVLNYSGFIGNAVAYGVQLGVLRVPVLGNGAQLTRVRVSDFPANRITEEYIFGPGTGMPTWPADPTGLVYSASRSFTALLTAFSNNTIGGNRNWFCAGIPASLAHTVSGDTTGLQLGACPGFGPRFAALGQFLVTGGLWGWLTRRETLGNLQVSSLVTNAAFPGMIGLVVPAALAPFPLSGRIVVRGFRRINTKLPPLNGIWSVGGVIVPVAPSTSFTYFLYNSGAVPTNNYKALGTIVGLAYTFSQFDRYQLVEITERKRGGSIGRPRGRSPSRA